MIITDDIYEDLSKRIERGEFIRYSSLPANLPALPAEATDEESRFRDECQATLSLYQAKMKLMAEQIQALRKAADIKENTDSITLLVADYNSKLEKRYEAYKTKMEKETARLNHDLLQMKKQTANVLEENQRLKVANEKMSEEVNRLEVTNRMQQAEINRMQLNRELREGHILPDRDKKKMEEMLAKKDAELAKMTQSIQEARGELVKMAKGSIEYCIAEVADIEKKKYDEKESAMVTAQSLLMNIVAHGYADYIDSSEVAALMMSIMGIEDKRNEAKKQKAAEARQEAAAAASAAHPAGTTINYYASVGQAIGNANIENKTKEYGTTEPKQLQ